MDGGCPEAGSGSRHSGRDAGIQARSLALASDLSLLPRICAMIRPDSTESSAMAKPEHEARTNPNCLSERQRRKVRGLAEAGLTAARQSHP